MKKSILTIILITSAFALAQTTTSQKILPVAPAASPETDLNARVKRDLMNDPAFSSIAPGITVENLNGQLTLRGQVPSREIEMNLINRASQLSGISSINNQLTIAPSSSTQSR